jgi:uncharacterized membrane protein YecN with MAPEG domain
MTLPLTTLSACALALFLVILSLRIISVRRGEQVSLGSGDNKTLERRIRAQGNLVEYGPMGLILIGLAELQGANTFLLGIVAAAFVMGRLLHGYALGFTDQAMRPRVTGMLLTLFSMLGMIGLNMWRLITG